MVEIGNTATVCMHGEVGSPKLVTLMRIVARTSSKCHFCVQIGEGNGEHG